MQVHDPAVWVEGLREASTRVAARGSSSWSTSTLRSIPMLTVTVEAVRPCASTVVSEPPPASPSSMQGAWVLDPVKKRGAISGNRCGSPSGSWARLWDVIEATVRAARLTDLPALAAIDDFALPGSERGDELHNFVTGARGRVLVSEIPDGDAKSVIGYVAIAPRHFFGRDFIALVVVAPSSRRRGAGTQLLNAAVNEATSDTVFTSTNESNTAMRALLVHRGWLLSGVLDGLDEGDPEMVFYRWT